MIPAKDPGRRELEKRAEYSEPTFCIGCRKKVNLGDDFTWAKTKGHGFVYLCADCTKKEGVKA